MFLEGYQPGIRFSVVSRFSCQSVMYQMIYHHLNISIVQIATYVKLSLLKVHAAQDFREEAFGNQRGRIERIFHRNIHTGGCLTVAQLAI